MVDARETTSGTAQRWCVGVGRVVAPTARHLVWASSSHAATRTPATRRHVIVPGREALAHRRAAGRRPKRRPSRPPDGRPPPAPPGRRHPSPARARRSPAFASPRAQPAARAQPPQKSPAEILSSKKRQRTPPSADRRDRPELPWTDLVCVGKGTYGEVYRARPDDARRRVQGTTVALKKFIQRDDDWGFPITTLREHKILLQLRHANLIRSTRSTRRHPHTNHQSSWSSSTLSWTWRSSSSRPSCER